MDATDEHDMEQRATSRTEVVIQVSVILAGREFPAGRVRDVSHNGAFVDLMMVEPPAVGATVTLLFQIWTGRDHISRQLRAKVTRRESDGLALRFTDNDLSAAAVVQDVLYYQRFERRTTARAVVPSAVTALPAANVGDPAAG